MLTLPLSRAANLDTLEQSWMQEDPDANLVAAAQADPRAFAMLYERYREPIQRYCYNRTRNRQVAEDAAADVFLEAFANLRRYPGGPFASWLYTIAAHVVADYWGSRGGIRRPLRGRAAQPWVPCTDMATVRPVGLWS
jgi:DNA-directed RNA polymerase specialized sigma24 family protein